jgi:hypothetical protein
MISVSDASGYKSEMWITFIGYLSTVYQQQRLPTVGSNNYYVLYIENNWEGNSHDPVWRHFLKTLFTDTSYISRGPVLTILPLKFRGLLQHCRARIYRPTTFDCLLPVAHEKWVPCHSHSGFGWRRPPGMDDSYEFREQAVAEIRKEVVLQLGGWTGGRG